MPSLWRRKGFHCLQLTQIFRNSRSLYTIHLQIPSFMPLEMRKVQLRNRVLMEGLGAPARRAGFLPKVPRSKTRLPRVFRPGIIVVQWMMPRRIDRAKRHWAPADNCSLPLNSEPLRGTDSTG